ncbi:MAG: DUF7571 family protein [Halohasta sp.]
MQTCHSCQTVIDEYTLDNQLEPLRDLTADDFNVCADCVTVDVCVECGGAVYVPRGTAVEPDLCPACRAECITVTGQDLGWTADELSG